MPRKTKVSRRGKNEGSVYQRKDGRWVGQVTVGYREDNLMLTGMRIGEALALQWKHVDFQNRTITVQQSLTRELEFDGEGRTQRPPPPWASPRLAAPGGSSRYRIWSFSVCGSGCGMCPSGRAAWRSRCSMQWASTYSHSDIEASRRELR